MMCTILPVYYHVELLNMLCHNDDDSFIHEQHNTIASNNNNRALCSSLFLLCHPSSLFSLSLSTLFFILPFLSSIHLLLQITPITLWASLPIVSHLLLFLSFFCLFHNSHFGVWLLAPKISTCTQILALFTLIIKICNFVPNLFLQFFVFVFVSSERNLQGSCSVEGFSSFSL